MTQFEALLEAGVLTMWLPPWATDDPARDTRFLATVRARRDALEAYARGEGPEPDAAWSLDEALKLRVEGDPKGPRPLPSAFRTGGGHG